MAGNRNNGHFTSRAYHNIVEKYYNRTRLKHTRLQTKNRLQNLRRLYTSWRSLNTSSGLGQANGIVVADDDWWDENTQVLAFMCL